MLPLLAITMGDPAGVGPELCLRALADPLQTGGIPVVFGDASVLHACAATTGYAGNIANTTSTATSSNN